MIAQASDDDRSHPQSDTVNCSHLNAGFRLKSSCIPPANTVPHDGQIIVHSTGQHSITWKSDHRAFHQSTQYHMMVRSSCIPPVITVSHGNRIGSSQAKEHFRRYRIDRQTMVLSTTRHGLPYSVVPPSERTHPPALNNWKKKKSNT